jgi:hypothetical protein
VTGGDGATPDTSFESKKRAVSADFSRASVTVKSRKVRFQLDLNDTEPVTDADISTDMDESSLSISQYSPYRCSPKQRIPSSLSQSSPLFNSRLNNASSLPPIKKRKIEAQTYSVVYAFFGEVKITKLTVLRILEFLGNKDLYAVSLCSVLLYSAALDDALWE